MLPTRAAASHVTWAAVEPGFHVASRDGEYVGYAERTVDGHFVGFDGRSTPVGRYISLAEAQRAVESAPANEDQPVLSRRAQGAFQAAAALSGIVAIGTFAAAVFTLPML
ncbi:peptide ABC transporter permease [Microbacterium sp. bgisy203]|uniref:peptide ABC transporter permease n=1 Tax=Microbacterium sp. bgisy203 TaxID=3413799 RepID=UPI003D719273